MPHSIQRRRSQATAEQPSLWSYVTPVLSNHWGIPRAVRARMAEEAIAQSKIELPGAIRPPKSHRKRKRGAYDPIAAYNRHLRRTYGITLADYDAMLAAQGGTCAICGQAERTVGGRHGKALLRFAVDHDHATGKVRALLCHNCNSAIGSFHDDTDVMLKAIGYVRQHKRAS